MFSNHQQRLFGYNNLFNDLVKYYKNNTLPNKIIFSGKKGIGKTTLALHFINYVFSENETNKYDFKNYLININNKSYKLTNQDVHPNFYYINKKSDKKKIEISQIRELNGFINKSSFNDKLKIVLIDDVEHLSLNASNSLLKIIEEPNKNVQFILIFDNSKFILDTIKSRCIEFKLKLEKEIILDIIKNYYNDQKIHDLPDDFKDMYLSPLEIINLIKICNIAKFNLNEINIHKIVNYIINNKLFKSQENKDLNIKLFIEIYFYKLFKEIKSKQLYKLINLYNKKYNDVIKYNLDIETFFLEFKSIFLK